MVNIVNDTKLFTPKNIHRFAKKKCKLLYGILGQAIPNTDSEYSTIAIALTPDEAVKLSESAMGDAIEVWVIDDDVGVLSEKWEPEYFREHFREVVEYTTPSKKQPHQSIDDGDENDDDGPEDEEMGIEMTPGTVLNQALVQILECEEMISKVTAGVSFGTGHPIDIDTLLKDLQSSVAKILSALSLSKGGFEPKFKKKGSMMVPYWTKTQIRSAKIKPSDL